MRLKLSVSPPPLRLFSYLSLTNTVVISSTLFWGPVHAYMLALITFPANVYHAANSKKTQPENRMYMVVLNEI